MSNQLIRKAARQRIRLITIISTFSITLTQLSAQINLKDTTAFRREFEQLLTKYGISNKGYVVNITSVNQTGGQTAFIITNNYFRDSLLDENNIDYTVVKDSNSYVLIVSPKKDIWVSPFVLTDSASAKYSYFDPGIGISTSISGISVQIENKLYSVVGIASSNPSSKRFPMHIYLRKNDPNQFFIFGDFQNGQKSYLFQHEKVTWFPAPDTPLK